MLWIRSFEMIVEREEFFSLLIKTFEVNGMSDLLDSEKADKLYRLTVRLLEENKKYNLTAITDLPRVVLNHYADSAVLCRYIEQNARVADIGCGAGFPSLPLAILRPDLHITAIDSTAKRITYVNDTAAMLGSDNIVGVAMRAEDGGQDPLYRERFDVCTARAVAQMRILSELCMPYVKKGGVFMAMKGPSAADENKDAENAIRMLGGAVSEVKEIVLTDGGSDSITHPLVFVEKVREVPKEYPRQYARILKKPL